MKTHNYPFITAIVLATAALTAPLPTAFADSHTWAGVGITGNWSLPANWVANNPPAAGEAAPVILIFPSSASRLTNTNNVAGLVVDGLSISGNNYVLHGSGSGTNLTFHDNGLNSIFVSGAGNTLAGTLNLTLSGAVQFNVSGGLAIASKLLGAGSLTKNLPGTLTLKGAVANAFTGGATVTDGVLNLASGFPFFSGWIGEDAVPGSLTIGNGTVGWSPSVVLLQSDQIADAATVTLAANGSFLLNNYNESIGALNLTGGYVQTGTGTLTLGGNVIVNTNPNPSGIYGLLSLGGATRTISGAGTLYISAGIVDGGASAGLIKTGAGLLELGGSNSFSGTTVATGGRLILDLDSPVGSGSSGTFITNTVLQLLGATVTGHPLTLAGSSSIVFTFSNSWNGAVTLATDVPVAGTAAVDSVNFNGVISGAGSLELNGAGTVKFSGAGDNTYAGNTALNFGTLLLQKPAGTRAVSGNLIIGRDVGPLHSAEVRLGADNQIINGFVGSVTVKNSGYLNLNNHNQTVPQLLLSDSAQVDSGINGMLTLGGNLAFSKVNGGHSDVYGRISLGGADRVFTLEYSGWILFMHASISDGGAPAGFRLNGGGTLFMLHSNSFSGPLIIDNSVFIADDNFAFGATNGGTFLTNDAVIDLEGISVAGEPLSIASTGFLGYDFSGLVCIQTNSWSGPVQLVTGGFINSEDTNSVLNLSGPISGAGGLTVSGSGLVRLTGTAPNTFTGALNASVKLLELNKTNALAVYGPLVVNPGGTVRHRANHQILDTSPVLVQGGGFFDLNGFLEVIGDFSGVGSVNLGAGKLTVGGANLTDTFSGVISGAGGELDKIGLNTLVLSGNNTYTAGTLVKGGKLIVNGSQPSSDVYVYSGATIGGSGTLGKIYGQGGTISPGNSPGKLNSGSLVLNTNTAFFVELNGPNVGAGYDQLDVTGSAQFTGPVTLNVSKHFVGAVGNQYVILNLAGGAVLFERFAGLPEGAAFTADGTQFSISYHGGTGNDVVLTQLSLTTPPQINTIQQGANGSMQVLGQGLPGYTYTAQANDDLTTTNWIPLGIILTEPNTGDFSFYDLDAPNHSKRFYRLLAQ